jgi:polysaccharide biosynthesis protein PslG
MHHFNMFCIRSPCVRANLKVHTVFEAEEHGVAALTRLIHGFALLFGLLFAVTSCLADSASSHDKQVSVDPRDDQSPWGVASGAEWLSAYPTFNPMLKQAGVRWLRAFYEWQTIQPKQGHWSFTLPDRLVANARENDIHVIGILAYLAPWASADGSTRSFPIKDLNFWRDYVSGLVERYHSEIKYWEVWNEFNGSFAQNGTPKMYAELVREASLAAKRIDPSAKIGLSVANFDVNFIDAAIKAGASGYFDYICVHPYEVLSRLSDQGEPAFLNMTATLRDMLKANQQPDDIPLWITEIGSRAAVGPNATLDNAQAILLAKAYLLSIAAGFKRVFWFEARGPAYSDEMDFGLIRPDLSPRPSYDALKTLTAALGPEPTPAGWLDLGDGGYGFLFNAKPTPLLAAWSPAKREINITFDSNVRLLDLAGRSTSLPAGQQLKLSGSPVLVTGLSTALINEARARKTMPYPWAVERNGPASFSALLAAANIENGIRQVRSDTTIADPDWRRTDFSQPNKEGHYVYFALAPHVVPFGTRTLEITAVVRRISPDRIAGMTLDYESTRGYVSSEYHNIPEGGAWQEISWKVEDASFVGSWGWNFRLNAISSPNEFLIREIKVREPH